jgi:hypothetical protein
LSPTPSGDPRNYLGKITALAAVLAVGAAMATAFTSLPLRGNTLPPTFLHVAPRYLEQGLRETGMPSLTFAVLMDYRSFDLLLISFLLLVGGLLGFAALSGTPEGKGSLLQKTFPFLSLGLLLSSGVGLACVLFGSNFLDYESLPLPLGPAKLRWVGALLLSLGTFCGLVGTLAVLWMGIRLSRENRLGR